MRVYLARFGPLLAGHKKSLTYRFGNLMDFTTGKAKSQAVLPAICAYMRPFFRFSRPKNGQTEVEGLPNEGKNW